MNELSDQVSRRVGIEVSNVALTAVCLGADEEIIATHSAAVSFSESGLSQLTAFISELRETFGQFESVGVALPGLVDREAKRVAFSARIPEFSGLNLGLEIESATGVRAFIENDANAAAFGEFRLGAGRGSSDIFYATLGVGVGGSLIFGGEIWRGVGGFAGELGYVPIDADGTRLEEVASAANIIRRTRSRVHQDSTSSLVEIGESNVTIADIVTAAEAEDDFARLMLERTGTYVGTAVASVINLLNIEKIVIGGEIMRAGQLVLNGVIQRAKELSFGPSFAATSIVEGELGDLAAAAGVALLANRNQE